MKRVALLLALAAALALAVVAAAAPPPVDAEAYLVQNAGTGEVLASFDERERLPSGIDHEVDDGGRGARERVD